MNVRDLSDYFENDGIGGLCMVTVYRLALVPSYKGRPLALRRWRAKAVGRFAQRRVDEMLRLAASLALALALAGCTSPSLDMTAGEIQPAGVDGGIVIGSVLVQAEEEPPDSWFNRMLGRKAAGFVYEFEIIRNHMNDVVGTDPYNDRYVLNAKPGEERIFVARLPVGRYVFKSFRHEGLSAMGGELGLTFTVAPETTFYLGRLLVDVPRRVSLGVPYTYLVEDAREATLEAVRRQHHDIGDRIVNAPMQTR